MGAHRRRVLRHRSRRPWLTFFDDPTTILTNTTKYPQGFATPGAVQSITQATTGNAYFAEHNKMFGLYFQDDWKVNRRLTVNLGLRWDKDFGTERRERSGSGARVLRN